MVDPEIRKDKEQLVADPEIKKDNESVGRNKFATIETRLETTTAFS